VISWEDELKTFFPGYFLPAASTSKMSLDEAERFLSRLGCEEGSLVALLDVSVVACMPEKIRQFTKELQNVASAIPSRTRMEQVEANGVIRGRINVQRTIRASFGGRSDVVVTQLPRRRFDIPENILLVCTARRIADLLKSLAARSVIPSLSAKTGWGAGLLECAATIASTLQRSMLSKVAIHAVGSLHLVAAKQSPHLVHQLALEIYLSLERAREPRHMTRVLAEGALSPLKADRRFELAVIIRLVRCLESRLEGSGFKLVQRLIERGRREIFELVSGEKQILIYLDMALFEEWGSRELGMSHYFGGKRRRPDVSVEFVISGRRTHAVVIEAKESSNPEYLKEGFHEAILYRVDHGQHLHVWPGSILVVSMGELQGKPRTEDSVVAVGWKDWVPNAVLDSLLRDFLSE
jgi:hypothetical protein